MHLGHDSPDEPTDPVAKIFGVDAEHLLNDDQKYTTQGQNARNASFWDDAGPEEIKHLYKMIEKLTDKEIKEIAKLGGIKPIDTDIESLKGWIEEVGREDFYKIYNQRNTE